MSYTIDLSDNGLYLMITVKGDVTVEKAISFNKEVVVLSKKHKVYRYLYDVSDGPNIDSTSSNYGFVNEIVPDMFDKKKSKIALLVAPADRSHSFIELMIQNIGYNCRQFIDREKAVKWLLAE